MGSALYHRDAIKRVVTLTATADAPSGVTYQWQQGSGNTWTNLDAPATSTTKRVSFETRGTRKFKVIVQHTTVPSGESEAIYVTWDEWAIMADLVTALRTAVTGDANYISAQTTLVTCINTAIPVPTTLYTSFDGILDDYTGETKSKMDAGRYVQFTSDYDVRQKPRPPPLEARHSQEREFSERHAIRWSSGNSARQAI